MYVLFAYNSPYCLTHSSLIPNGLVELSSPYNSTVELGQLTCHSRPTESIVITIPEMVYLSVSLVPIAR